MLCMSYRLKRQLCDVAQGIVVVGVTVRIVLLQLNVKIPERETTSIAHTLFFLQVVHVYVYSSSP